MSDDARLPDTPPARAIDVPPADSDEIDVYARELAATPADERKRAALLLYEMGRQWRARDNLPNAAQCFLKAYTLAPEFRPVIRDARRIYRERGDFRLVIKLQDAEARATRPGPERAALLREKGRTLLEHQADRAGAEAAYRAALSEDPTDLAALLSLDRMLETAGDAAALREVLQKIIEVTSDAELQAALWRDIAQLESGRGDIDAALIALLHALTLAPGEHAILGDLERLYAARASVTDLCRTLETRLAAAPPGPRAAALEARIARLMRDRTQSLPEAADRFRRALGHDPDDYITASEYAHLCEELGRWDEVAWAIERRAQITTDVKVRASLYHRLGVIRAQYLSDPAGAKQALLDSVASLPTFLPALEALGRLLASRGEWQVLLDTQLGEIEAIKDPARRASRLYKAAAILERHIAPAANGEQTQALERAIELYARAASEAPGYLPAVTALERLYGRTGRFAELIALYEREAKNAPPGPAGAHLYEAMGRLWADRIGDTDKAIECFARVRDLQPQNLPALRELARMYGRAYRFSELVEVCEHEIALVTDPRRKVDLLQRAGELWEDRLLDLDKAAGSYQRALEIAPGFLPALKALGRLHRQKGRWDDLIAMHRAEMALTESPEQITFLLYAMAEIYDDELMRPDDAARTYREILERVPGYLPALTSLETLYEERRDWKELVALREASLEALGDDRSKALVLAQMGSLREERLDDPDGAAQDYARALRLLPEHPSAHAALVQIYELSGDHAKLADLCARALEHAPGAREHAVIGERLGELWDRHLAGPRKAATYYEAALEAAAGSTSAPSVPPPLSPVGVLQALAGIYRRLGMARELVRTSERLTDLIQDDAVAAGYRIRAAQLREEHQPALGEVAPDLRRALELSPGHPGAERALERVLRESGQSSELADVLAARLPRAVDPLERAALLIEIAEARESSGDMADAERSFRDALAVDGRSLLALWGLERLLEASGRFAECAQLALAEVEVLSDPAGQASALERAARLQLSKLERPDLAAPLYAQVLTLDPAHEEAFLELRRFYAAERNWPRLVDLLRMRCAAINDRSEIAHLLGEMADVYTHELGQQRKGMSCLRKALEVDPYDKKALCELARLYDQSEQWAKALTMYNRASAVVDDAAERRRMELRTAELWENLGDLTQALDAYRRVLSRLPDDEEALERASDLAEEVGDALLAARALERRADLATDPVTRVALRKRLAALCEERLEEPERAARALEGALSVDPLDVNTVEKLAALYGQLGDREALGRHLSKAAFTFRAAALAQPLEPAQIHALSRIYHWQKNYQGLFATFSILAYLGAADGSMRAFLHEALARRGPAPGRPLSLFEVQLLPEAARGPARPLWQVLADLLLSIDAREVSRLTPQLGEKVDPGAPISVAIGEIAERLGGAEYEVFFSGADRSVCKIVPGVVPILVLGADVAAVPLSRRARFKIARSLYLARERLWGDPTTIDLENLLAAAVGEFQGELPASLAPDRRTRVETEARRLHKLVPRKSRDPLRALVAGFLARAQEFDAQAFLRGLHTGAARAATLACGDPEAALHETAGIYGPHGREVESLVRFLLSDEFLKVREALGWV
ncbi:MAG TPA: hypothetical protein VKN99_11785 [Polyangia bacterium]|nr:hypothetical protein [Polyangia bacterium]